MQSILIKMLLRPQYIIIMVHIGILEKKKQTTAIQAIIITHPGIIVVALLLSIAMEIKLKQVITSVLMAKKLSKMLLANNKT